MNACPDIQAWDELASGTADARRAGELREHLRTCEGCARLAGSVSRNERLLGVLKRTVSAGEGALPRAGMKLGEFTIVRALGSGGMATVYEAQQERPARVVALKVISHVLPSAEAVKRFEREAELLGRLQHPGIARIYAAGGGEGGPPWLAMELVAGERLDEFVAKHNPTLSERVAIVTELCEAVDYAHSRGVVHRDLKPANILIESGGTAGARESRSPRPKVLDFGVACAVGGDVAVTTLRTDPGRLVGPLAYMSPAQAAGAPDAADARSDVYALGVVCYEMLSGRLPHEVRGLGITEAVRMIVEREPTPLGKAKRELGGDLETIIGKALERDPQRRYQSAAELGADLRRYVLDQPIVARPATVAYRARKFVARHRLLVGAAGVAIASLVVGLVMAAYGLVRATEERNLAVAAERDAVAKRASSEAITGLLQRMLSSANPHEVKGADYTVRQLLDDFSRMLGRELKGQPEVEASVRATVGNAYRLLGVYGPAREHITAAMDLRARAFGRTDPRTIRSEMDFAWLLHDEADYAGAASHFRAIGARLAGAGKGESVEWAASTAGLSDVLRHLGEQDEAERWGREAVRVRKALQGERHADTGASLLNLSKVLYERGAYADAERVGGEAIDVLRAAHGEEHPVVADALNHLAWLKYMGRDYGAAEELARRALEMGRKVLGERHPDVANSLYEIGMALNGLGRHEEAGQLFDRALEIYRQVHGEAHPAVATTLSAISETLRARKDLVGAEQAARQSLEIRRRLYGETHFEVALGLNSLGNSQSALGDDAGAMESFGRALEVYRAVVGPEHPFVIAVLSNMALNLQKQERLEEAAGRFDEALELSRKALGPGHPDTLRTLANLARLRTQQARHADAEALLGAAVTAALEAGGASQKRAGPLMLSRARSLVALGRKDEALVLILEAHKRAVDAGGEQSSDARAAAKEAAALLAAAGKNEEAAAWRARAEARE